MTDTMSDVSNDWYDGKYWYNV